MKKASKEFFIESTVYEHLQKIYKNQSKNLTYILHTCLSLNLDKDKWIRNKLRILEQDLQFGFDLNGSICILVENTDTKIQVENISKDNLHLRKRSLPKWLGRWSEFDIIPINYIAYY